MANIIIMNFWDSAPPGYTLVNATSQGERQFSPFYLGPCKLYNDYVSLNMENAWQFSKVYLEHIGQDNKPSPDYFEWAQKGWSDKKAHRYPMGKGAKPMYSWWNGEILGYVSARKRIYVPLYAQLVVKTTAYKELKERFNNGENIAIQDFDAYRHDLLGISLTDVMNNPNRKMGHGFVLAMLLTNDTALQETSYNH